MAGYANPRDLRGHQTPATTTPSPSPSHGPCGLATTSSCDCSNKLRVRGVTAASPLRSLQPFVYSGLEALSFFFYQEEAKAKGRTRPCSSRRGWRNCWEKETRGGVMGETRRPRGCFLFALTLSTRASARASVLSVWSLFFSVALSSAPLN